MSANRATTHAGDALRSKWMRQKCCTTEHDLGRVQRMLQPSLHIQHQYWYRPNLGSSHKKYIKAEIKPDPAEKIFFNTYDPEALREIINTQHQVVEYMKKEKYNFLYQILIVVDDFADDPAFTRNSSLLHQLYMRGRHQMISTITATQVYRAISPVVRKTSRIYVYSDWETNLIWMRSLKKPALYLIKQHYILKFYKATMAEPYSFLYVKLTAKTRSDMFYESFSEPIIVTDASSVCVSK